mmetsp:Transcript_21850/g.38993  ORF Transcript_21850/g.38993 Transcript_21850/m.38993 type:complete len:493 (-) Transcript_21850:57-1535(-)|eukprot:CAMPEP_0175047288 /NCGR_PEP_ID=MMETSP0052_2-20121109/5508_1 /TAXON_ID=51329 ORGANISM="Polytomella parva, Strain SAG 63-3" /NCGR_SAMPLE_ID=MMETSP0052_2 /ASSEMBLY_ACC=CAM_ASM_000194 /LENGTH=492 /DNA_ID=CAMNT_0016311139 /DNA_START=130 /DNA_END=1608 /DNA_ORIENTATION=-
MADTQVLVKFVTKLPQAFKVPETGIAVPPDIKRYGLSQIINHLLELDPHRPFDFIISGELLRATLKEFLTEKNLSAETTLEIEYVPAVIPPKQKESSPHDDWVSCVDGSRANIGIISGSYDGLIRIFDHSLSIKSSFRAHSAGVSAARLLPSLRDPNSTTASANLLATAGKDHLVKVWSLGSATDAPDGKNGPQTTRCVAIFEGHTDAVEALAVSPSGDHLLSAGVDGRVLLWSAGADLLTQRPDGSSSAANPPSAKKKRKTETAPAASADAGAGGALNSAPLEVLEPLRPFEGHSHAVSSLAWPNALTFYSAGWDHSIRQWDVEMGANVATYNGSKALYAVAASPSQPSTVAFGGADKALRLWDSRSGRGESINVRGVGLHDSWISSIRFYGDNSSGATHKKNGEGALNVGSLAPQSGTEYLLVTASYDCTVKLWDIRSNVPLATEKRHREKVLCVDFCTLPEDAVTTGDGLVSQVPMVSGGADCKLVLYA